MNKLYEASIWPNNQPPILLGYFEGTSKKVVRTKVAADNNMSEDDVWVEIDSDDTCIKRWRR